MAQAITQSQQIEAYRRNSEGTASEGGQRRDISSHIVLYYVGDGGGMAKDEGSDLGACNTGFGSEIRRVHPTEVDEESDSSREDMVNTLCRTVD